MDLVGEMMPSFWNLVGENTKVGVSNVLIAQKIMKRLSNIAVLPIPKLHDHFDAQSRRFSECYGIKTRNSVSPIKMQIKFHSILQI